jgi:glycosyltransferase involved in cell wall biosynthesis
VTPSSTDARTTEKRPKHAFRPRLIDQARPNESGARDASRSRYTTGIKLSIVMPAYNEQDTIADAVVGVLNQRYLCETELIVVDDGSTDATPHILEELRHPNTRVVTHRENMGKGTALQTGAAMASGTHIVPFDADLEYDPADLNYMLQPVVDGRSDVVYGVRLFGANTRYLSFRHAIGNRVLTLAANLLFDSYLSDLHTCLKLVPVDVFRRFDLKEAGFGLDTEVTARLLASGLRPFEVPVSYHSRASSAGKKITWRDGIRCLRVLVRVRSMRQFDIYAESNDPLQRLAVSREMILATAVERFATLLGDPKPAESHNDTVASDLLDRAS